MGFSDILPPIQGVYHFHMDGTTAGHYPVSEASNLDDGAWHHVACVVNGTAQTSNICFYLDPSRFIGRDPAPFMIIVR